MENVLVRTSSCIGESNLHLQITPAYRQDIFVDERVWKLVLAYMKSKLEQLKIVVLAVDGGKEHMHIFLANWKNYSIPYIVQQVKGYSSRMMRKNHNNMIRGKLWGKKFWSAGYFHRTVGAVTAETIKKYILEGQKKHWKEFEAKKQTTLLRYAS